jgi:hypothetical protein
MSKESTKQTIVTRTVQLPISISVDKDEDEEEYEKEVERLKTLAIEDFIQEYLDLNGEEEDSNLTELLLDVDEIGSWTTKDV